MNKNFYQNEKAVAAIEFAILLPIIFAMYAGFVTLTTANKTSAQVSKVASTVSDLLAQTTQLNITNIDNILKAGEAIAGTHNASTMEIEVIGIAIDDMQNVSVVWSRNKQGQTPYTTASQYDLPNHLTNNQGFVIAAKASLRYIPSFLPVHLNFFSIPISYEFYFVPRASLITTCETC